MANYIGQASCLTQNGYKGSAQCVTNPMDWKGYLLFPAGTVITPSQMLTLRTVLIGLITNNSQSARAFNFNGIRGIVSQSDARAQATFPDGSKITTRDGIPRWQFQFYKGLCDHIQNRNFRQSQYAYEIMPYDKNGVLMGTRAFDSNGVQGQQGWALTEIETPDWEPATSSTEAKFYMEFQLTDSRQMNENLSIIQVNDFNLSQLPGVAAISVSPITALSAGVVQFAALTGCGAGGSNLANGSLATAFSSPNAWVFLNGQTLAVIPSTTVVPNAATSGFTATLNTASPNYPTSGGTILVTSPTQTVLQGLGIKYYEVNPQVPGLVPVP